MKWPRWFKGSSHSSLDEEMQFHIEQHAERLMRGGCTREEAMRKARLEFGSVASYREDCRQSKGLAFLDQLRADLQFAVRILRKQPGLSATAILFLAVAVGANSAFFAFVNAYGLRPLPIQGADRHFDLLGENNKKERIFRFSKPQYEALRGQAASAAQLYSLERSTLPLVEERIRRAAVEVVSENFFPLLVGTPNPDGAVLSHAGWKRLFHRDPQIVGRRVRLGSNFFTISGVAPESFTGVEAVIPDFWIPHSLRPLVAAPQLPEDLQVGGILEPGVPLEQARARLSAGIQSLSEGLPEDERIQALNAESRKVVSRDDEPNGLVVGIAAFPFVLLLVVACANLASLYLAGASSRQRELAIRIAIGANRWRLVRQLMTEALLLAVIGAVAASMLAVGSLQSLQSFLFQLVTRFGMNFVPVSPDWRIFAVSLLLAVLSALLFGLLPSLEATDSVREGRPSVMARSSRPTLMRRGLLVTQTASSLVLLVLAGVLLENANHFDNMNPGFALDGLFDSDHDGELRSYSNRLEALPAVIAVTGVGRVPLRGIMERRTATIGGKQARLFHNYVDHRYFETMQIPLVEGRNFTLAEAHNQLPVAVISEATSKRFWPGRSAIGQSFRFEGSPQLYEVTGVARDVVNSFFFIGLDPTFVYLPAVAGSAEIRSLIVRARQVDARFVGELQRLCLSVTPQSYCEPGSMTGIAWMQRLPVHIASQVATALGVLSVVLSCVGLYGVVAFLVERRKREAGIRLALGASRANVMLAMSSPSVKSLLFGIGVGLLPCFVAAKFAESAVAYLRLSQPLVFVGAPLLLLVVGVAAALLPARRAASVDPSQTLRHD
ncbi:MAG: ABC transporter permease [Acidobacteria bacterium]|nr:ABC transporter permease [Acidobacteriota bacterium]